MDVYIYMYMHMFMYFFCINIYALYIYIYMLPPGEGNGSPLQCSCLENPMDRGAWRGYSPWGLKESDMTEQLN